jgi:peptidoglycan/xylan/chitin deacetylase (PgdA/CDA1 family)
MHWTENLSPMTGQGGQTMVRHLLCCLFLLVCNHAARAEIITKLPGEAPIVALTFDACETKTPSFFDKTILDYLLKEKIPATIFVNGKFARRNAEELRSVAQEDFIEIENHSLNHVQHMERLNDQDIVKEVIGCEALIVQATGKRPGYFRFPAGNHDQRSVRIVEDLGYRVVHWTFASGDPARETSPDRLTRWVVDKTRKGNILIFHINGRGYGTGEALPHIVQELRQKNIRFVLLKDVLPGQGAADLKSNH